MAAGQRMNLWRISSPFYANGAATPEAFRTIARRECRCKPTRNDVMHFDPDGIDDDALVVLRDFAKLLRALQTVGAT